MRQRGDCAGLGSPSPPIAGSEIRPRVTAIALESRYAAAFVADGFRDQAGKHTDIAVLRLDRRVTDVEPIRLAGRSDRRLLRSGRPVALIGRGGMRPGRTGPGVPGLGGLRIARLEVLADARCGSY